MTTSNLPAQVVVVRKLPLYRWLVAGAAALALLVGAAQIKSNHKTVLQPVAAPIVQVLAPPKVVEPAPAVRPAPKKQPAKPATRKGAPKKV